MSHDSDVHRGTRLIRRKRRALVGAMLMVVPLFGPGGGCTESNARLNPAETPLERRTPNATRAATFARLVPLAQGGESKFRSRAEILDPGPRPGPATGNGNAEPAATAPATLPMVSIPPDADGCFVGMALSGGGSRSANFAAACMFQLERFGLLQKVDYISTVSGGSLAGAYYCVSGDREWNPGNVQRRLTHSFASDLINGTLLSPWSWPAFWFSNYDRSDVLAASFQRELFTRDGRALTYADLRADRPRLLVNATDLQSGRRFIFCNESFDDLNSDLSRYPVTYAVTASSAVPVLLHPVTLHDYSTAFDQYRHLIDGGVTDNLGITTLVETYASQVSAAKAAGRADPYPNGAVFIIVDAHTYFDAKLSGKGDVGLIESLKTAAGLTSTALLNRASSATLADIIVQNAPDDATARDLRSDIAELNRSGYLKLQDRGGHTVNVIYLSLSQVNDLADLPFQSFSESVNSIETYFNISPTEAYDLYQAAELLVRNKFEPHLREVARRLTQENASPTTVTAPAGGRATTQPADKNPVSGP
jgi:predicted acylesterase/phospholipase RssA